MTERAGGAMGSSRDVLNGRGHRQDSQGGAEGSNGDKSNQSLQQ